LVPVTAPTRAQALAVRDLVVGHLRRTPTIEVEVPDVGPVTLKLELLQHTGSFKPRGAFAAVLTAPTRPRLLVAASGGNHGLAVAHVGAQLAIPTRIFVPRTAPEVKVAGLHHLGADVRQVGDGYAQALEASRVAAAEPGALAVHAYDEPATVLGQASLGLELDEDPHDDVLVAVGGGGLLAGVAIGTRTTSRVVGVEPTRCDCLAAALAAGRAVGTRPGGVAADALGASTIGAIALQVARRRGVRSVLVDDDEIREARRWLWRQVRVAAEPAGATALAALLAGRYRPSGRCLVVICGGNADPSDLT
jgi:threonine dehydratase